MGHLDVVSQQLEQPGQPQRQSRLSSTTMTREPDPHAEPPGNLLGLLTTLGRSAAGSRTVNTEPLSGPSLVALRLPPCNSASERARVRPIPSPPSWRASERDLSWAKGSKICESFSAGIPMPVSRTLDDHLAFLPERGEPGFGRRPSVYLTALFKRLVKNLLETVESASTHIVPGAAVTVSKCFRSSIIGRTFCTALSMMGVISPISLRELDLAPGDPRNVQQVFDQPGQVLDLAVDHRRPHSLCCGSANWPVSWTALLMAASGFRSS